MKTADIEIGREYALGTDKDLRHSTTYGASRVMVVAKGEALKGRRWSSPIKCGVRVAYLDRETGEPKTYGESHHNEDLRGEPITGVVRSAGIREDWAEYWRNALICDERREESRAREKKRNERRKGRIAELNALLPEKLHLPDYTRDIPVEGELFLLLSAALEAVS